MSLSLLSGPFLALDARPAWLLVGICLSLWCLDSFQCCFQGGPSLKPYSMVISVCGRYLCLIYGLCMCSVVFPARPYVCSLISYPLFPATDFCTIKSQLHSENMDCLSYIVKLTLILVCVLFIVILTASLKLYRRNANSIKCVPMASGVLVHRIFTVRSVQKSKRIVGKEMCGCMELCDDAIVSSEPMLCVDAWGAKTVSNYSTERNSKSVSLRPRGSHVGFPLDLSIDFCLQPVIIINCYYYNFITIIDNVIPIFLLFLYTSVILMPLKFVVLNDGFIKSYRLVLSSHLVCLFTIIMNNSLRVDTSR